MRSPRNVKEVQCLTGRVAALNRFISKFEDKCREFFAAIKKGQKFEWTTECEAAFLKLKEQLGSPPLLAKPTEGEALILYLGVSEFSISAVLIKEEEQAQQPVYYVSKRLLDAETRYSNMEKLAYALILASRKLRPYFQAHQIEVRTSFPLRQVLHKPEASGRIMKWAVELGQFDIEYKPRTAIKGQALADFILEFPPTFEVEGMECIPKPQSPIATPENCSPWWNLYVDGAVNGNGAGADLIGELPKGKGGVKYAVVAVDYFTKWAEAEPLASITARKLVDFVYRAIVCRYGVPYKLISDNGKQFDSNEMMNFFENLGIKKGFSAVCHPQSNGQTEAVNKIIKHTLKAKLEEKKGCWPEELPMVLWSYNTTPSFHGFGLTVALQGLKPIEAFKAEGLSRLSSLKPIQAHKAYLVELLQG
ncbi:uncharacterized protein LOC135149932 [Daucus carota subsp. sativus]|uniref:uncharacterized protein LOC135149932 n=1 Tax=Daucus carota subsp. sativus TaxID=79200 RepID=UPI0030832AA9